MIVLLVYAIGILFCLLMAWCLGANDAANPTECAVGAGVIPMKRALLLFALFTALGGILLGPFVMKTIDRGIVPAGDPVLLSDREVILGSSAAIIAASTFLILCTWKGMPVSTTHSIIGGVLGYGLATAPALMKWDIIQIIALSIALAPFLSILVASGLFAAFRAYFRKPRGKRITLIMVYSFIFFLCFATSLTVFQKVLKWPLAEAVSSGFLSAIALASLGTYLLRGCWRGAEAEKVLKGLLILALAFSGFAFGANDMANATGAFISPTERIAGTPTLETMFILAALGSAGIAVGGFTWGYRVIRTSAFRVTKLSPLTGLAAETSNALTIFLFTVVPKYLIGFGIPISTTHASISSIIGVGLAEKGFGGIDKLITGKILLSWGLTIPCVALLSMTFLGLFNVFIP